jgi:hypothetical protein
MPVMPPDMVLVRASAMNSLAVFHFTALTNRPTLSYDQA